MPLSVEALVVGPFQENTFVVSDDASHEAILVDPGGEVERIAGAVSRRGLRVAAVVNTHGHIDHVIGVAEAMRRFGAPFWIHAKERGWVENLEMQAMMFGLPTPERPRVDRWLADGDTFQVGAHQGRVIHTPGHTEGGVCLFFEEARALLTGDTLFAGSVGRTDLPGGDGPTLIRSIRERLWALGDDVDFYPGHGPGGTLGHERRVNPFAGDE